MTLPPLSFFSPESEEPRASPRGLFQRKSQYDLKATSVQNYTAIPPRSSERGILAFSRECNHKANKGLEQSNENCR
jgi:hypothetical protein